MKISIITATFNSGKTVRDTLESVLRQTFRDIEYIIVDGASTDDTLDAVREYEPKFGGRLRWISEPDRGIYDAMNKGLAMATGEVVGILNSDDFFSSDEVLEHVADALSNSEIDAVYGDIHFVRDDDLTKCVRYYSSKRFRRWQMRMGFMPAHPSFYCRRSVYERYGVFDPSFRISADFELLLRLIFIERIKAQYISMDFVTMRIGGASTSGMKSYIERFRENSTIFKKNGVYSNYVLESFRYLYKLVEVIIYRVKSFFQNR